MVSKRCRSYDFKRGADVTDPMRAHAAKRAVVGIVAHVDAGKTTLNEALIYRAGLVRDLGSVDGKTSHLDYHAIEQQRGITVYAKQTVIERHGVELTLLDTPGHVDFAAEVERVLHALDYAILLVNGSDGIQGHTLSLWQLLESHGVPTALFVNKMDFAQTAKADLLCDFQAQLSPSCIDFTSFTVHSPEPGIIDATPDSDSVEACAATDEQALEEYLDADCLSLETMRRLFAKRLIFPCFFGSALKQDGVDELIDGIAALAEDRSWPDDFGARVFKISHDASNARLTWMKVTGGSLAARQRIEGPDATDDWSEKVDQIRLYTGSKFSPIASIEAGRVCAVTGLSHTRAGMALGSEAAGDETSGGYAHQQAFFSPAFSNSVQPVDVDITQLHAALNVLTDEDPLLNVRWNERLQELQVQLMGTIQLEILQTTLKDRFGIDVTFGPSGVLYRETIAAPVTGIGHFEPLRHYAEVHLLMEPLPAGSGVVFGTCCHVDQLDLNWQRLILTNAMEREHAGVLIGAPITDMRITLIAGRAHNKHTEGGDFRQATYRAIRQGLMQAESVLLEPWHRFQLRVPTSHVGRALADLQRMSARVDAPQTKGEFALIGGVVPAKEIRDYPVKLASYSQGKGSISLMFSGYEPCHDAQEVIAEAGYNPEADATNTPNSVFCSHGAGHTVAWSEVAQHAHVKPDPSMYAAWREATPEFFGNA